MIFIPKWMRLAREGHKTGAKLVEPRVHQLVEAGQPRRLIPFGVMLVEGINHLMHFVKSIKEEQGRFLVGVPECSLDFIESIPRHVYIQPNRHTLKYVNGLGGPLQVTVKNSFIARHEEDATQEDIEFLEIHFLAELLVHHQDEDVNDPLIWKAHPE
jgi:hypothetical protein